MVKKKRKKVTVKAALPVGVKTSGLAKQTTEEGIDDETLHTDTIFYGDRNLYIVGNQNAFLFLCVYDSRWFRAFA